MNLLHLYGSTKGRISRLTWWFGAIGLVAVHLVLRQPLALILQYEPISDQGMAYLSWATEQSRYLYVLAHAALLAPLLIMGYCLSVKRRHDRGAPGWEVMVAFAVFAVAILLGVVGPLIRAIFPAPPPTGPDGGVLAIFLFTNYMYIPFLLYVLIVLGFLKGTAGPNYHGPDPLARTATA